MKQPPSTQMRRSARARARSTVSRRLSRRGATRAEVPPTPRASAAATATASA
jgi:hypothetical protein